MERIQMQELTLSYVRGTECFIAKNPKIRYVKYPIPAGTMINLQYYLTARRISSIAELVALHIWKYTAGLPCRYVDIPYKGFEHLRVTSAECKKALKALLAEGVIVEIERDRYHMSVYVADSYLQPITK
jgi:hypothetical protein